MGRYPTAEALLAEAAEFTGREQLGGRREAARLRQIW